MTAQDELRVAAQRYGQQAVSATDEKIVRGFLAFAAEQAINTSTIRLARYAHEASLWTEDPVVAGRTEMFLRNLAAYPINETEGRLATFIHSAFLNLLRGDARSVVRAADRVVAPADWPRVLYFINT